MAYNKTTWVDGVNGGTPITAAKLNNIENGIVSAAVDIQAKTTVAAYTNTSLFTNYGTAGFDDFWYAKNAGSWVNLGGMVKQITAGSWSWGVVIATLPAGYRPTNSHYFLLPTQQSALVMFLGQIKPTGDVCLAASVSTPAFTYSTNTWISFDGITFKAEQ